MAFGVDIGNYEITQIMKLKRLNISTSQITGADLAL